MSACEGALSKVAVLVHMCYTVIVYLGLQVFGIHLLVRPKQILALAVFTGGLSCFLFSVCCLGNGAGVLSGRARVYCAMCHYFREEVLRAVWCAWQHVSITVRWRISDCEVPCGFAAGGMQVAQVQH